MMAASVQKPIKLHVLMQGIADAPAIAVDSISLNSQQVSGRCLFLALSGDQFHGIRFAEDAIKRGAVAIATDLDDNDLRLAALRKRLPVLAMGAEKHLPALLASRLYGAPSERLSMIAVTGTNGKSSISWLVAAALRELGKRPAVIGTLGSGRLNALRKQDLTTPDAVNLQRRLSELLADDVDTVALEASSHALTQGRLSHTNIDIAVFSNLSRDHLDYHGDMDSYFEAKAALFVGDSLRERIIAVDDEYGQKLYDRYAETSTSVSTSVLKKPPAHFVYVKEAALSVQESLIRVCSHHGDATIRSALIGEFNVQNLCLAFAVLLALDVPIQAAADALGRALPPPGRMQRVAASMPAVFVDFSHTPDALAGALQTLRQQTVGQLICVFGCGGDRDRGKRAKMSEAAENNADRLILTSDNPREEPIDQIFDDMCEGLTRDDHRVQPDRRLAIREAIGAANEDDVVLIAGKGHETVQTIGRERLPFDDVIEARLALRDRSAGQQ